MYRKPRRIRPPRPAPKPVPPPRCPLHIELFTNRRAVVEGCLRITQYTSDTVGLYTAQGEVLFHGEELRLTCLSDGTANLVGKLTAIQYANNKTEESL